MLHKYLVVSIRPSSPLPLRQAQRDGSAQDYSTTVFTCLHVYVFTCLLVYLYSYANTSRIVNRAALRAGMTLARVESAKTSASQMTYP